MICFEIFIFFYGKIYIELFENIQSTVKHYFDRILIRTSKLMLFRIFTLETSYIIVDSWHNLMILL